MFLHFDAVGVVAHDTDTNEQQQQQNGKSMVETVVAVFRVFAYIAYYLLYCIRTVVFVIQRLITMNSETFMELVIAHPFATSGMWIVSVILCIGACALFVYGMKKIFCTVVILTLATGLVVSAMALGTSVLFFDPLTQSSGGGGGGGGGCVNAN